jgi:hypothetical protein
VVSAPTVETELGLNTVEDIVSCCIQYTFDITIFWEHDLVKLAEFVGSAR